MRLLKLKYWMALAAAFFFFAILCAYDAQAANIVIRAVVVNPSPSQKRTVPFKSYLPREIKPENVVDKSDLDIAFDPKEGSYYVFKDYTLEPKQVVNIEVELEDVWKIPQADITSLRQEAGKLTKVLANTDYYERANYLKNSMESKLDQIEHTQSVVNPNPGVYISDYRDDIKLLESIKTDLASAKTLVTEAKSIAPMITWKLIVAIVVFLGVLGLVFFVIWHRQIKSLAKISQDYEGASETSRGLNIEEGERRKAEEDKKSEISDIEDRLNEKP